VSLGRVVSGVSSWPGRMIRVYIFSAPGGSTPVHKDGWRHPNGPGRHLTAGADRKALLLAKPTVSPSAALEAPLQSSPPGIPLLWRQLPCCCRGPTCFGHIPRMYSGDPV
jgi:hypothetical protein